MQKNQSQPSEKISAKLSNAGYYGNWYGHQRLIKEFGYEIFQSITYQTTKWANQWINNPHANLFVGVSISFGERTGNTFIDFLDIFDSTQELKKVIAGSGEGEGVASCLFNHNHILDDLKDNYKIRIPRKQQLKLYQPTGKVSWIGSDCLGFKATGVV